MGAMLSRMISLPRRAITRALQWINDNPLPTAGVTMAAVSAGYLLVVLQNTVTSDTASTTLEPTFMLSVASERPAYLLAIVVGIGTLVLWRE